VRAELHALQQATLIKSAQLGSGLICVPVLNIVTGWQMASEQDDPDAMYRLAFMHKTGRGDLDQDDATAVSLEKSA
jgi:hypothetical protein